MVSLSSETSQTVSLALTGEQWGLNLLAAFGGGIFGSIVGGTIAFVIVGLLAIVGSGLALAGITFDFLGMITFGPFFGPHTAFAGAVAAAALAGRLRKRHQDAGIKTFHRFPYGYDCNSPLLETKNPLVLVVGGFSGLIGVPIFEFFRQIVNPGGFLIDSVAVTVAISGLLARLLIANSSPLSPNLKERFLKIKDGDRKEQLKLSSFHLLIGLGVAAGTSYIALLMASNPATQGVALPLVFGVSGFSLLFLYSNVKSFPVTHHLTISTTYFAVSSGSIWAGLFLGGFAYIAGIFVNAVSNTNVKSHWDMPAIVIAFSSILAFNIWPPM